VSRSKIRYRFDDEKEKIEFHVETNSTQVIFRCEKPLTFCPALQKLSCYHYHCSIWVLFSYGSGWYVSNVSCV